MSRLRCPKCRLGLLELEQRTAEQELFRCSMCRRRHRVPRGAEPSEVPLSAASGPDLHQGVQPGQGEVFLASGPLSPGEHGERSLERGATAQRARRERSQPRRGGRFVKAEPE